VSYAYLEREDSPLPLYASLVFPTLPQGTTTDVPVRIEVPAGIPIVIEDARAKASKVGLKELSYSAKNSGDVPVVALEIDWEIRFADGSSLHAVNQPDWWYAGPSGWLAPGAASESLLGPIGSTSERSVSNLVGRITYVELQGGTRFGPNADSTFSSLNKRRLEMQQAYRRFAEAYSTGGREALLKEIRGQESSQDLPMKRAATALLRVHMTEGTEGVVSHMNFVINQAVPQ
jgi:hypothetical protein